MAASYTNAHVRRDVGGEGQGTHPERAIRRVDGQRRLPKIVRRMLPAVREPG